MVGRLLGTTRSGQHLQNETRGTITPGGASGALAETLLNKREGTISGMSGKSHDSAKDNEVEVEVEVIEGRDESQGCHGTGDVEEVAEVPKANDSALADATDVDTIRSKLWELQRLLNNRLGSLCATCKKNAEANTRGFDLNQKNMQALGTLAAE